MDRAVSTVIISSRLGEQVKQQWLHAWVQRVVMRMVGRRILGQMSTFLQVEQSQEPFRSPPPHSSSMQ